MNKFFRTFLLLALLNTPLLAMAGGNRQLEVCTELTNATAEMADMIAKIESRKSADAAFLRALNTSQKAWLEYMQAQVEMELPSKTRTDYATVLPMCLCVARLQMIEERMAVLAQWVDPGFEGDVCTGNRN